MNQDYYLDRERAERAAEALSAFAIGPSALASLTAPTPSGARRIPVTRDDGTVLFVGTFRERGVQVGCERCGATLSLWYDNIRDAVALTHGEGEAARAWTKRDFYAAGEERAIQQFLAALHGASPESNRAADLIAAAR